MQAVLLLLVADLAKYWFHRFSHETDFGWRLHSVHHAVKRVYWLNGFRIHPIYHLINFLIAVLPWVCLGAKPAVVALYTVILSVSAAFQHANIDLDNGWLNYVFNTNQLHRWHHSRKLDESNANYGAVILLWDLLFGTYRKQTQGAPEEIGMVAEIGYPMHSYMKQLVVPFLDQSRFRAN
jgi:sterol desaturase/sphingolipid hydroxylase (fatty acid hydroxylase superfamily)